MFFHFIFSYTHNARLEESDQFIWKNQFY